MSVAVTRVGNRTVLGDKHAVIVDLVFTSTYPDEGEPLTAAQVLGVSATAGGTVTLCIFDGIAPAADGETAVAVSYDYAAQKVRFFESAATGLALLEKTAAEAYPTSTTVRALVFTAGVT